MDTVILWIERKFFIQIHAITRQSSHHHLWRSNHFSSSSRCIGLSNLLSQTQNNHIKLKWSHLCHKNRSHDSQLSFDILFCRHAAYISWSNLSYTNTFFISNIFSTQPQCCLTFSWIELQMLLRCCLIHITIIILRHILYLVYLSPCVGLDLRMSYLCDQFFIFSLIFIVINHATSLKQMHLLFVHFLEYPLLFLDDNMDEESE